MITEASILSHLSREACQRKLNVRVRLFNILTWHWVLCSRGTGHHSAKSLNQHWNWIKEKEPPQSSNHAKFCEMLMYQLIYTKSIQPSRETSVQVAQRLNSSTSWSRWPRTRSIMTPTLVWDWTIRRRFSCTRIVSKHREPLRSVETRLSLTFTVNSHNQPNWNRNLKKHHSFELCQTNSTIVPLKNM